MASKPAAAVCDRRRASMIRLIATAKRTRVCFSPASGRPRSANTLPELLTTTSLFLSLAISHLVILACYLESPRNQFHIRLGRLYAFRRFLLERMQYVSSVLELYAVYSPVGVPSIVLNYF